MHKVSTCIAFVLLLEILTLCLTSMSLSTIYNSQDFPSSTKKAMSADGSTIATVDESNNSDIQIDIYYIDKDAKTVTKQSPSILLATTQVSRLELDETGSILTLDISSANQVQVYFRTNGIFGPTADLTLWSNDFATSAISPDGSYLAVGHTTSFWLRIY